MAMEFASAYQQIVKVLGYHSPHHRNWRGAFEHHLKLANGGEMEGEMLEEEIFDSIRRAERDGDMTVAEADIARIWVTLKDSEVKPAAWEQRIREGDEPQGCLRYLWRDQFEIGEQTHNIALLQILASQSRQKASDALQASNNSLEQAVLHLKKLTLIDDQEAASMAFCLLTDCGIHEAKAVQSNTEMLTAVHSRQPQFASRSKYCLAYVKAALWPYLMTAADLETKIVSVTTKQASPHQDGHTIATEAAHRCSIFVFMRETAGLEVQAMGYLAKADGDLVEAIKSFQRVKLTATLGGVSGTTDTNNPPYVEVNTHILAVLGTVERPKPIYNASPQNDGWFIADFYLWKHVLRGMGASDQTWMTCLDPQKLVDTYCMPQPDATRLGPVDHIWETGYVHGQPGAEDRRIVLNQDSVEFAQEDLGEDELHNNYLEQLEQTCAKAEAASEPVLLLLFAHGDLLHSSSRGGLQIGLYEPYDADRNAFLTAEEIVEVHQRHPSVRLMLFMTSCFSGNWVMTPYFQANENVKIVSAANDIKTSFSWQKSTSLRHAGGVFSTAFMKELMEEPASEASAAKAREYHDFMHAVQDTMNGIVPDQTRAVGQYSRPMFTVDGVASHFFQRTGYALHDYRANYSQLPQVDSSTTHDDGSLQIGAVTRVRDPRVHDLLLLYDDSRPPARAQDNKIISMITGFKSGAAYMQDEDSLEVLHNALEYRLGKNTYATRLAELMEVEHGVARIDQCDSGTLEAEDMRTTHLEIFLKVQRERWFDPPDGKEVAGMYMKPAEWLTLALVSHGATDQNIDRFLQQARDALKKQRNQGSKRHMRSIRQGRAGDYSLPLAPPGKKRPTSLNRLSLGEIQWEPASPSPTKEEFGSPVPSPTREHFDA